MMIGAVGDVAVDTYARVATLPAFGEKLPGEYLASLPGGVGANVCVAAAVYGAPTRLFGAVGDDDLGELVRGRAAASGVDVDHCLVRPGTRTTWNFVALSPEGEKALTIMPTENFFPQRAWFDAGAFEGLTHFHAAPFDLEQAHELALAAQQQGASLSLDLEPAMLEVPWSDLAALIGRADVVTVNEYSYARLFADAPWQDGLARLRALGPTVAMGTLGAEGLVVATAGEVARVDAFAPSRVVDTTGAGDGFIAVFLVEWLEGTDPVGAARTASVAAGLSTGDLGAQGGYQTRETVARQPLPAVHAIDG